MGFPKGTKLSRDSRPVMSKKILIRCLELQEHGILPTIKNLGPIMGCGRDNVIKLRNELILDGLVKIPNNKFGTIIREHDNNPMIRRESDPSPEEQHEIESRIEEIRKTKKVRYNRMTVKECRVRLINKKSYW